MSLSSRIILLASVVLTGCIDPITPTSLDLSLETDYVQNGDGTCTARVTTMAAGVGTALWEDVTLARGEVTQAQYTGADVADFWGATTISAGQIQVSAPFQIPAAGTDYSVSIGYQIAGVGRDMSLRMDCATVE